MWSLLTGVCICPWPMVEFPDGVIGVKLGWTAERRRWKVIQFQKFNLVNFGELCCTENWITRMSFLKKFIYHSAQYKILE